MVSRLFPFAREYVLSLAKNCLVSLPLHLLCFLVHSLKVSHSLFWPGWIGMLGSVFLVRELCCTPLSTLMMLSQGCWTSYPSCSGHTNMCLLKFSQLWATRCLRFFFIGQTRTGSSGGRRRCSGSRRVLSGVSRHCFSIFRGDRVEHFPSFTALQAFSGGAERADSLIVDALWT